jgi:hypothetical protein
MSSQRASAREAIATIGHALAGQSQPIMFVGGTVTALYPLEGGMALRPTLDVDCVVDLATTAEYYAFVERLRALGFRECTDESAPLCRRVYADIRVDIVATSAIGIGPTNRWYRDAFVEAAIHSLESGIEVRAITPLYFVATKLEAFRGRGAGDDQASHDLEDVLTVLSGLHLAEECPRTPSGVEPRPGRRSRADREVLSPLLCELQEACSDRGPHVRRRPRHASASRYGRRTVEIRSARPAATSASMVSPSPCRPRLRALPRKSRSAASATSMPTWRR